MDMDIICGIFALYCTWRLFVWVGQTMRDGLAQHGIIPPSHRTAIQQRGGGGLRTIQGGRSQLKNPNANDEDSCPTCGRSFN
jgi:hypothetical protein